MQTLFTPSTLTPEQQHAHLLAESERVGWPVSYKTDLLHDLRLLTIYPTPVFGWALRSHGTDIFLPVDTLAPFVFPQPLRPVRAWGVEWARCVGKDPANKLYWFDGKKLRPVSLATLLEHLEKKE
jgi:hypothetical protein